jgi:hypothetical protein
LGVPRRLEPLHPLFPLTHGLVGVLRTVIEIPMLAVLHPRQNFPLRRAVAFELISDDDARHVPQAFEQLAEELLGGLLVPSAPHQEVEHMALLIHGTPQIVPFTINRQEHLIDVIVTTHNTLALVFQTQVDKLKRGGPKNNLPASISSCSFMQHAVMNGSVNGKAIEWINPNECDVLASEQLFNIIERT